MKFLRSSYLIAIVVGYLFIFNDSRAGVSICQKVEAWTFHSKQSGRIFKVIPGYSLTDPVQRLDSVEGYYESNIIWSRETFDEPSILIPAVGGLTGIKVDGIRVAIPYGEYASVGPVFSIPKKDAGQITKLEIEISGDDSSYAGFWKDSPVLCNFQDASHIQMLAELYQRRVPNFFAVLCFGLSVLFLSIYFYTSRRFVIYKLFYISMAFWAIYFLVLSGFVRGISYKFGTYAIFPARIIAGLGLLLLYYSYWGKRLRRVDQCILVINILLLISGILASIYRNFQIQIILLISLIPCQIPVIYQLFKERHSSKKAKIVAVVAIAAFAGLCLDLFKLVGPTFGIFSPFPYLERITMPPILFLSSVYFLGQFVHFYARGRLTDFRHRALGKIAMRLAGTSLGEKELINLARSARHIHLTRRTSIAKRLNAKTYEVIGVSGFDTEAVGSRIDIDNFVHLRRAIDLGDISIGKVISSKNDRYKGEFSLAVPIPLSHNPAYVILFTDILKGRELIDTDLSLCRQFYASISAAVHAYDERVQKEERDLDFKNLVEKLDPNLFEFIQRNVKEDRLTVDATCNRGVIFFDQKSYTTMLEQLHPDRAALALYHIKSWVSSCCLRQNGRLKGFYGDAFVVEIYPLHNEDESLTKLRTAEVAWDLCESVDELNRKLVSLGFPLVSFRFGAHYGLAANVDVDLVEKGSTTLIGDAVNLAQRIQSQANPGMIYVSDTIAEYCKSRFIFIPIANRFVKGRSGVVNIFRLVGRLELKIKESA